MTEIPRRATWGASVIVWICAFVFPGKARAGEIMEGVSRWGWGLTLSPCVFLAFTDWEEQGVYREG